MMVNDETVKNFFIVQRARNNYYWIEIFCVNCKTMVYTSAKEKDKDQAKILTKLKNDIPSYEIDWLIHLMSCPQYQAKTQK